LSKTSDLRNLFSTTQQSHGNEGKYRADRETTVGTTWIFDFLKGFKKTALTNACKLRQAPEKRDVVAFPFGGEEETVCFEPPVLSVRLVAEDSSQSIVLDP
jgi:hypothetical protein